jgi:carboxyl-terminal processing protease
MNETGSQVNQSSIEQGIWRTVGYNKCFELSADHFVIHDLSEISCIQSIEGPAGDFYRVFDRIVLNQSGQLQIYARGGITRYLLEPLPHLPQLCRSSSQDGPATLAFNFEVFWHYFKENYAFFDLRHTNWQSVYHNFAPCARRLNSPSELAEMLEQILCALNDSHATLEIPGQTVTTRKPHELVRQWQAEFHSNQFLELYPKGIPILNSALNSSILQGQGKSALNGQLLWGKINPRVGYLSIFSLMDMYASFDLLHYAGFEVANLSYLQSLGDSIDQAITDLSDTDNLILDLRFNPGGHDAAGKLVASRFANKNHLAFTKQVYDQNGLSAPQEIFIEPAGAVRYTRPVMLLISEATASAAEVLVHFMMPLPNVTRLGGATRGVLSDTLLMQLPIGWTASVSNEIYTAANGICYESTGIPPQIEAATFYPHDFYPQLKHTVNDALSYT